MIPPDLNAILKSFNEAFPEKNPTREQERLVGCMAFASDRLDVGYFSLLLTVGLFQISDVPVKWRVY